MGSMSDLGLPERQMTGRVEPPKGMLAILEQLFCKYWNRLEAHWSEAPWRSIYKFCIIPFESTPLFQIIIE